MANQFRTALDVTSTGANSVSSSSIANDSIVNADIKSDAAIAGTKIDPTFSDQTLSFIRNLAAANTSASVVTFKNDNASDDQAVLELINDVTTTGVIKMTQNAVTSNLTVGSGAPSGGADGDVYIRVATTNSNLYVNKNGSWTALS